MMSNQGIRSQTLYRSIDVQHVYNHAKFEFFQLLQFSKSSCIMCVQYHGGVQNRGGYHEYCGGYHEYHGGYHEYRGG